MSSSTLITPSSSAARSFVRSVYLTQINQTDIRNFIKRSFFAQKLSFDNQLAYDQLDMEIGTRSVVTAHKTFGRRLSDGSCRGFFEHVAGSNSIEVDKYLE